MNDPSRTGQEPMQELDSLRKRVAELEKEASQRGRAEDVLRELSENPNVEKGEYCAVVRVPERVSVEAPRAGAAEFMLSRMLAGLELSEAAEAAQEAGYARNEIYRAKLEIKRRFGE